MVKPDNGFSGNWEGGGSDTRIGFFKWDLVNNLVHWECSAPKFASGLLIKDGELDRIRESLLKSAGSSPRIQTTLQVELPNGATRELNLIAWVKLNSDGRPTEALGACVDPASSCAILPSDSMIEGVVASVPGFLFRYRLYADGSEKFSYMGEQCASLTGIAASVFLEDVGAFWSLIDPSLHETVKQERDRSMRAGTRLTLTLPVEQVDRSVRWIHFQAQPRQESDGSVTWDGVAIDATEQKRIETQIESQGLLVRQQLSLIAQKNGELEQRQTELADAYHQMRLLAETDSLTDVSNRHAFKQILANFSAPADAAPHLLLVDIDGFRELNNSIGNQNGDEVLKVVARRLNGLTNWGDKVARLSGDVFAIMFGSPGLGSATDSCERVLQVLGESIELDNLSCQITCSVGAVTLEQLDAVERDTALLQADLALQVAKSSGGDQFVVYAEELGAEFAKRKRIERDLAYALAKNELFLMYQPIIEMETGLLAGFEALCRWKHPERGLISPAEFIPVAERTGLIVPIGEWVLQEAVRQTQQWKLEFGLDKEFVTVNVSAAQLMREDFESKVILALVASGLSASNLKLEVTESLMVTSSATSVSALGRIRQSGVRVALDDFGTGYSSIGALRHLPIDTIKLDRSFVKLVGDLDEDSSIIQAILSIARALKADVVAEGIESAQQAAHLKMLGCEFAQGFFFSKPLSVADVDRLLASKNRIFESARAA
ncbi:MAG: EAL domain-containing protein [Fimbriimonadaceae bacterium]